MKGLFTESGEFPDEPFFNPGRCLPGNSAGFELLPRGSGIRGTSVQKEPKRCWITDNYVKFPDPKHEPVNPRRSIDAFLSVHAQKEGSTVGVLLRGGFYFDG